nr:transposase [Rhizobium sp. Q54]
MGSDEPVVGNSEVKKLEDRVRELERLLGRKTMEVEILREALSKADSKNGYRGRSCCRRTVPDEGRRRHAGRLPFQEEPSGGSRSTQVVHPHFSVRHSVKRSYQDLDRWRQHNNLHKAPDIHHAKGNKNT